MRICSVEGCTEKHFGRGLCIKHYGESSYRKEGREREKKKYEENREKELEKRKLWYQEHKEEAKERGEKYRKENKEVISERDKKYRKSEKGIAAHARAYNKLKEKHAKNGKTEKELKRDVEKTRRYQQTEKGVEAMRNISRRRRAAKKTTQVEFFQSKEVYERDNWICGICGEAVDKELQYPDPMSQSLDHIVPLSRGGSHTKENCQLAHLICNLKKGNKT